VVLDRSELGDMIVVKHGRRSMQLAWTHLLPATFGGRAMLNVQNVMAAAAAAFAAGAPLHDIRQGLRTFSTSYYLSPGRLNEIDVDGRTVIVDYCHNAPAMRMLGDFVDRLGDALGASSESARPSRIGVVATAGDRRDADIRELGEAAAQHFDVVIVREDERLRGRPAGEVAELVATGVREAMDDGARCRRVETVLDEIDAVRHALSRSNPGDLVVLCVDQHKTVLAELETVSHQAQAGARSHDEGGDPDFVPPETPAPEEDAEQYVVPADLERATGT
ncbi:MAG TPA: cyanophycin synthetase, partial [Kribbellaceae bacterium]|nr:cyanophycin synthetase [Kribbellaceae bacterium]